jgi:sensor histidine kinase YesM
MVTKETKSPFNNPLLRFLTDRKFRLLRHAVFIAVGLMLAFKGDILVDDKSRPEAFMRALLLIDTITFVFIMGMIYLLVYALIPRLLFRSRPLLFTLCFVIIVSLIYLLVWILDKYILKPADNTGLAFQHVDFSLVAYIQICLVGSVLLGAVVGLAVFKKWIKDVQHMNELREANLRTELEQLKSQVNPHFLFNTLNNLIVLTKTDPEKASQILFGLSDLLRYQLYDSAREKILLSKDIEFIRNLLALEKIRREDFTYDISIDGKINGTSLPPFLFIPFVENAIKHGASTVGHSYLQLAFRITDQHVHFYSENSKPLVKNNQIGGLGLKNINRRLGLIYPGTHKLEITDTKDKYIVNLTIPL